MNLNIENKILIPILLLVILPLLAVGIFYYRNSQNLFLNNLKKEIENDLIEVKNIIKTERNLSENNIIEKINIIKEVDLIVYDIDEKNLIQNKFKIKDNNLLRLIKENDLKEKREFNINFDDKLVSFVKIEELN